MTQTKNKRGLGRGLSALIPGADMEFLSRVARGDVESEPVQPAKAATPPRKPKKDAPAPEPTPEAMPNEAAGVAQIALDDIEANPYQPRRTFNAGELEDLAASIREHGVLQPVLLRPAVGEAAKSGKPYQLIAGERRWRAARAAGLERVPAIVRDVADQQALELAVIENVQRHDISPLDAAHAYRRLSSEFGLSQEAIAKRVGKSRPAVTNVMRLLDLPEEVQRALEDGTLSEGHGRAILQAHGEGARRAVFRRIVRDQLTVRDAEQLARESVQSATASAQPSPDSASASAPSPQSADLRRAAHELQRRLGARLQVRPRAKGGQIVIDYADAADFERLFALLGGK